MYSDDINELMILLLGYLQECESYSLDMRLSNFECFYRLEKFLDSLPIRTCAEIHLDGEEYFATVEQSVQSLISKCIQKTEWLFIKDFNIDFNSFTEVDYCSALAQTKCLTIVDSYISGLPMLLEAMNAQTNLETLVVIYNVEVDEDDSEDDLVNQLRIVNLSSYERLNYFELSFYNNV